MTTPKSTPLANHEIVTLAVYLLGGEARRIDSEDIAVKTNEIAPRRFTWRKYSDQINLEAVRKRLWDARKSEKGGYVIGSDKTGWALTPNGLSFARANQALLNKMNLARTPLRTKERNLIRREYERLAASAAFVKYSSCEPEKISLQEAESFFRVDAYVTGSARVDKIMRLKNLFADDPTRVLADYGWLPDGRIFLSYKLSEGSLANGIVSIPAGMKSYLQGEFRLLIADGQSAGRLVVKDNSAWGLGPFFRRRGGEPGDYFQIIFDTKQGLASVHLCDALDEEDS